jgi:hypothetical protein
MLYLAMGEEFVRISHPERIYGKSNFLQSQLEMLNLIKNFRSFKKFRKEEFVLKVALKSKIGETLELIESLNKKLPKIIVSDMKESKKISKKNEGKISVQEEMEELQRKLVELRNEM